MIIADPEDKAYLQEMAKEEYYSKLSQMNDDEAKNFEKTAIIQMSVDEVKKRAQEMEAIRKSPDRYKHVKSKVASNLKIQMNKTSPSKAKEGQK